MEKKEKDYPVLLERFKAVFVDSIILVILMKVITDVFSLFENVPDVLRGLTFLFIFFLYDPIFISAFGGTIGHRINGIRVKKETDVTKNISFPMAIFRFIIKALLGWISLLTVTGNDKKKAIHDNIVRSVVVYSSTKK